MGQGTWRRRVRVRPVLFSPRGGKITTTRLSPFPVGLAVHANIQEGTWKGHWRRQTGEIRPLEARVENRTRRHKVGIVQCNTIASVLLIHGHHPPHFLPLRFRQLPSHLHRSAALSRSSSTPRTRPSGSSNRLPSNSTKNRYWNGRSRLGTLLMLVRFRPRRRKQSSTSASAPGLRCGTVNETSDLCLKKPPSSSAPPPSPSPPS